MSWFTSFFSETKETCMKKCEDKYKDDTTPTEAQTTQTTENSYAGQDGGSRRRRCTKKHRHSSACKKLKAKKSKGRKSYRKRR
jgi:hypothetical protein